MNWIPLLEEESFIENINGNKTFAVFKHSTTCSISSMAKSRLERSWNFDNSLPIYYLDLKKYRPISNLIAEMSGVHHESPQLLFFKNGKVAYQASHNGIDLDELAKAL